MAGKYKVEEVKYSALILDDAYVNNILIEEGEKRVVGGGLPRIGGNRFNIVEQGKKYAFGCSSGAFTYNMLLSQIKAAQEANNGEEQEVLKPIKGGNTVTSPVVEESATFFITKSGKAYAKDKYTKSKEKVKVGEKTFGKFTWTKRTSYWGDNNSEYQWNSNSAGNSRQEILDAMLEAKEIIDFLEERGDYAPKAEESIEEAFG